MSDEVIDLHGYREAKAAESEALRFYADGQIECYAVLVGAIEQMLDFSDRANRKSASPCR